MPKTLQKLILLLLFITIQLPNVNGQIGRVLSFDGIDDGIMVNSDENLRTLSELTMEVWVKLETYENIHVVHQGASDYFLEAYKIGIRFGIPEFRLRGGAMDASVLPANTLLNLDEWYHIAVTYDGTEAKMYLNGVLENSAIFNEAIIESPGGNLYIGIDRDGESDYNQVFKGCLDEVRIWNRVRTQEQIQNNMLSPLAGDAPGLIAYYDMEQVNGELEDVSVNENNGILLGPDGPNNFPTLSNPVLDLDGIQTEYFICSGATVSFNLPEGYTYNWSPANLLDNPSIANPTSIPLEQGVVFTSEVQNICGFESETVNLSVEVTDVIRDTIDLFTCPGEALTYGGEALTAGDIRTFSFSSQSGCDSLVTINVSAYPAGTPDCEEEENDPPASGNNKDRIFIPNVFSPNEDGVNDLFCIYAGQEVESITEFRIFDQWGEQVFQNKHENPQQADNCWDGRVNGRLVSNGVFVYFARIRFANGETEICTGDVTVIR